MSLRKNKEGALYSMKKILIFYGILVIVIIVFAVSRGANLLNFNFGNPSNAASATIGTKTYSLLLAKTEAEKELGLSKRESLSANMGMLFAFETKGIHKFWMNEMRFPIDIIFINDNKIVDFVENAAAPAAGQSAATLPVYAPSEPINYVLEVNANEISKNKFKRGDSVTFKNVK